MQFGKKQARRLAQDLAFDVAGSILIAVSINSFLTPAQIAPGGVSGLSVIINYLTDLPTGTMIFVMNIPLLILAWLFLGKVFTLGTLKSVAVQSLMVDLLDDLFPKYYGDAILSALFGGILLGIGLSLIFMRGYTTGGTDIVCRLIQRKYPYLSMGKLIMMVDMLVVLASILAFHNIESGLYAVISIYTSTKVIDGILFGMYTGKIALIISDREEEIVTGILVRMDRGVTLLKGEGAYSGQEKKVILCAVRTHEYTVMEEIVRSADPNAFVILLQANEIVGSGFRPITEQKIT